MDYNVKTAHKVRPRIDARVVTSKNLTSKRRENKKLESVDMD